MIARARNFPLAAALACAVIYAAAVAHLKGVPYRDVTVELRVALPRFAQVLMAAGDRFLAADLAAIRALVVATDKMKPEEFALLARIQEDVAWFNPGHEDNYYTAAAILPWNGELDAAQRVLAAAVSARPFDYQPAFYQAFHEMHFNGNGAAAHDILVKAAATVPNEDEQTMLRALAAIWAEKSDDVDQTIRVVRVMAEQAKRRDFRKYLEQRVARLESLKLLRTAAGEFAMRTGAPPRALDDLRTAGLITEVPKDPFGYGFAIDAKGSVMLRNSRPRQASGATK